MSPVGWSRTFSYTVCCLFLININNCSVFIITQVRFIHLQRENNFTFIPLSEKQSATISTCVQYSRTAMISTNHKHNYDECCSGMSEVLTLPSLWTAVTLELKSVVIQLTQKGRIFQILPVISCFTLYCILSAVLDLRRISGSICCSSWGAK